MGVRRGGTGPVDRDAAHEDLGQGGEQRGRLVAVGALHGYEHRVA